MEHRSLAPNLVIPTDGNAGRNQLAGEPASDVASGELLEKKQMGRAENCSDLELSNYLQALAEGCLVTYCSDTKPSARSKSISIASRSYRQGRQTVHFHGFPSLEISRNSTGVNGEELLTWYRAGFPARTSASSEAGQESMESAAVCGEKWPGSLAKYDRDTCSWKTAQLSLLGDSEPSLVTWPRSGLMLDGQCWELQTLVPRTSESASGYWPTPNTEGYRSDGELLMLSRRLSDRAEYMAMSDRACNSKRETFWPTTPTVCGNHNRKGASATSGDGLATVVAQRTWPTATATATAHKGWSPNHNRADTDDRLDYTVEREAFQPGQKTPPMRLSPDWVELLMGWPKGWTRLSPLE